MNIQVQSIHFNADRKLLDFIQKKANKLDTFYDHIISGEIYLRVENVEDESNKVTEIKLMLPGTQLFAKCQCKSFEEATDMAIESLRKQVDRFKRKKTIAAEAVKKAVLADTEEEF